jgi:ribosomal protein L37E
MNNGPSGPFLGDRMEGSTFITKEGTIALVVCPECGKENYAMNVMSGVCTWCGYDANKKEEEK